ncbi:universal stress protein [bacterium BMS3Bbin02]|nr:universal stress protein [bacterium BMS3Bbin02]
MKIVVGFIDSPEGDAAIDKAVEEAKLRNGSLVVVHSKIGGRHDKAEDYVAMANALDGLAARLAEAGIEHDIHEYVRGDKPAEDLIQAVEDYDAELIVIGIRERSATGKMLLGSNALDILHYSPVPVLCVKAK